MIRELVREMVGFAYYEKRIMEMIKINSAAASKKALVFAKKRLGTMRRARTKREELENVVQNMRHHEEKDETKAELPTDAQPKAAKAAHHKPEHKKAAHKKAEPAKADPPKAETKKEEAKKSA